MEPVALYGACAAARFGIPHFEGGVALPASSHHCLAIWRELAAPHSTRVPIENLQL